MIVGQADQNGLYVVNALRPGKYTIVATIEKVDSGVSSIAKLWKAKPHAKEVQVGAKATVDIRLVPESNR